MSGDAPDGFEPLWLGDGFSNELGEVWVDRAGARMRLKPGAKLRNPVGSVHGGAIASFADAQIAAVHRGAESGLPHTATIKLTIDYMAPAVIGAWLEMRVTLLKVTRTMIFTRATIHSDGELVANSTAIYNNKARTIDNG